MRRQTRLALARSSVRRGMWWSWAGGGLIWTAVVESSSAFERAWELSGTVVEASMAFVAIGAGLAARRWGASPTAGVLAVLGPLVVSGLAPGDVVVAVGLAITAACGGWVVGGVSGSVAGPREPSGAAARWLILAAALAGVLLLPLSALWLSVIAGLLIVSGTLEGDTPPPVRPIHRPTDITSDGTCGGSVLEARDLALGFGTRAVLTGASLRLAAGEVIALVGANGSGKSTLLRVLGGHLLPERGELCFKGESILGAPPEELARLGVALASGSRPVFPDLAVRDNMAVAGWALAAGRAARHERIAATLAEFPELAPLSRAPAGTLSGGEQRLLALAQSLLAQPAVLLADEVTLGLSPGSRRRVLSLLRSAADAGAAVVVVEHDLRDVLPLADRLLRLENGVLRQESSGESPGPASFIPEGP